MAGEKKSGSLGLHAGIEWSNFKWPTRSGLKIAAVTDIIISMLQAAGLTETYLQPAVVCFEQDPDLGYIGEEDPENNVQHDEAGIVLILIMKKILMNFLLVLLLLILLSQITRRIYWLC